MIDCATGRSSLTIFFKYAWATAICSEVMQLNDLKQLPRKANVDFSPRVDKIVYQFGDAFLL